MKKSDILILASVLIILSLTGCATAPPPKLSEPIDKTRVFNAAFDKTWDAAIRSVTASGEVISTAQKESGLISFSKAIPTNEVDKYALAPDGMIWDRINANVNFLVRRKNSKSEEKRTKVTINNKINGIGRSQGAVFWYGVNAPIKNINMASKGKIEKEYFSKIANFLPGGKEYEWLEEEESEKKETDEESIK